MRTRLAATALLALGCFACTDPVDKAAKQRVFSAEDPPRAKLAAAEPIESGRLASDPKQTFKVLDMGASEAIERIGPHRFKASASFVWRHGKSEVKLSEQRAMEQAGTDEFALKQENDRDQGVEVIRTGGRTYSRSKYLPFRERKRDRGQAEKLRDDTFAALRSVSHLLQNRLAVIPDGESTVAGRAASRYKFVLAPSPLVDAKAGSTLPEVRFANNGPDADTKRRLEFEEKRVP
ncbi:MAG: hypothetical protein ACK4N5_05865, partial [Myxococcales bacterium]